jgi:hypothetical protein
MTLTNNDDKRQLAATNNGKDQQTKEFAFVVSKPKGTPPGFSPSYA